MLPNAKCGTLKVVNFTRTWMRPVRPGDWVEWLRLLCDTLEKFTGDNGFSACRVGADLLCAVVAVLSGLVHCVGVSVLLRGASFVSLPCRVLRPDHVKRVTLKF